MQMLHSIRNVYCVGRNYRLHAAELGNSVPEEPMIFTKPTHSLVSMVGQTIYVPGHLGALHYEGELVLHIGRSYEEGLTVDQLVDQMALGIDFTLRDLQNEIKQKGYPWLPAKGFLNSAPITAFHAFPGWEEVKKKEFTLEKNGQEVQRGNIQDMIFDLQTLVDFIGLHYGLGAGDLIFTGTPAGVGKVCDGDQLELFWDGQSWGKFYTKINCEK